MFQTNHSIWPDKPDTETVETAADKNVQREKWAQLEDLLNPYYGLPYYVVCIS